MDPLTLTPFEIGQLYAALGVKGMAMLSPELRTKIKDSFKAERAGGDTPPANDAYEYATHEQPQEPTNG